LIRRVGFSGDVTDRRALVEALAESGLSKPACRDKAALLAKAADALASEGVAVAADEARAYFVPGRIEVLGKHTDYAGGSSIVAAAERGLCLVVVPRDDNRVRVIDPVFADRAEFPLDPELVPRRGHWSNYPMTVARRVTRNFPGTRRGADIALCSDLSPAAGMSSSSALIVAVFLALSEGNALYDRPEFRDNVRDPADLAGYLGTVENGQTFGTLEGDRGVGTFGGSEDHTAILTCRPGHLSQYAYCPVRFERAIRLPEGFTFAIGVSGVVAEKTGAAQEKYNRASRLAARIAELWRQATGRDDPHLAAALATGPDAAGRLRQVVQSAASIAERPALADRLEHFLAENEEILPAAGDALAVGDVTSFGEWVDRSQQAAEELLGNQVPETIFLARSARDGGAVAASAFGAGFGGSVWALIETDAAEVFLTAWANAYRANFPHHAPRTAFFPTPPAPAAFQIHS